MEAKCKKCGRVLRDPVSIARGMGSRCAGIARTRKSSYSSSYAHCGSSYPLVRKSHSDIGLVSFGEEHQNRVPETLEKFPAELLGLVLSAPSVGTIATQLKTYAHRENRKCSHPGTLLKQIRWMCIEFRLLFWPGLFKNLEPIPCIPCGENDWKIGENGRVINKDQLVAYLSRYGIIAQNQPQTTL